MGGSSKPKPEDYAPTEMEKFNAAIAVDASNYFKKLEPLIVKDIQSASDLKLTQMGKGRAQADFAQALTKNLDMKLESDFATTANRMLAGVYNQTEANLAGVKAKNADIENALNIGLGLESTAASGVGQVATGQPGLAIKKTDNYFADKRAKDRLVGQAIKSAATFGVGNIASHMAANKIDPSYQGMNPFTRARFEVGDDQQMSVYQTAFGPFGRRT